MPPEHGVVSSNLTGRAIAQIAVFASGWIVMYYGLTMHWWFPRQDEWTVVQPD